MKKVIATILCIVMMLPCVIVNADNKESDLQNAVKKAIEWKADKDSPLADIGSVGSNLYIIALNRMGKSYDYNKYLSGLDEIASKYNENSNATDMQLTLLATEASGGDARNVGGRDLVADGVYYRSNVADIDKDGMDGYSWGLISLDAKSYEAPQWALLNRNDLIVGILSNQNTDGSFNDSIYSTAVAVTALAPYFETSGAYTITQKQTGAVIDLSPKTAIEKAVEYLSKAQDKDGDFGNLEATAMTVIALDTIGVDADNDDRFIAKNGTALEALLEYQQKDGGFSSGKGKSDGRSTSFALCAMTSHLRKIQKKSTLFNFEASDNVVIETPAPTVKATATKTPTATVKPKTTVKPTSSPKTSAKISGTMKPTKTASPFSPTPKSSASPKPSKKPALVGPVEMPGPMPSEQPYDLDGADDNNTRKTGKTAIVIVFSIAILCVGGILCVIFVGKKKNRTIGEIFGLLISKKDVLRETYEAKMHRKMEKHRSFEEREKYKQRLKFKHRSKR